MLLLDCFHRYTPPHAANIAQIICPNPCPCVRALTQVTICHTAYKNKSTAKNFLTTCASFDLTVSDASALPLRVRPALLLGKVGASEHRADVHELKSRLPFTSLKTPMKRTRRGRDSNPRYRFSPVQRFSKPSLSASLRHLSKVSMFHQRSFVISRISSAYHLEIVLHSTAIMEIQMMAIAVKGRKQPQILKDSFG